MDTENPRLEFPFFYLALLDFVMGISVVAPLIYAIEWLSPYYAVLSGALHSLPGHKAATVVLVGLVWTLLTTCTNNTGISWSW